MTKLIVQELEEVNIVDSGWHIGIVRISASSNIEYKNCKSRMENYLSLMYESLEVSIQT